MTSKAPSCGKIVQQVQLPVLNHGADLGVDLPELAVLLEVFDQHLNRKAALHLELAVDAGLRLLEHFLGQVGRDDFDAPSGKRRAHFLQAHRERIRLLAGRAGGAPDPDALAARARLHHLRHDRIAEVFERHLVAEEEGLVGGHGFDHLGDDALRPALHLLHEVADARQAAFARQRKQAAFDQILLVCRQIET